MTAPMNFWKSLTSPIRIVRTSSTRRSRISGHRLDGAKMRDAAEHFWPWYSKLPRTTAAGGAAGDRRVSLTAPPHTPRGAALGVGRRVGDDEVLAAGLADDARVVSVVRD